MLNYYVKFSNTSQLPDTNKTDYLVTVNFVVGITFASYAGFCVVANILCILGLLLSKNVPPTTSPFLMVNVALANVFQASAFFICGGYFSIIYLQVNNSIFTIEFSKRIFKKNTESMTTYIDNFTYRSLIML